MAYPVARIRIICNANARMLNVPEYHDASTTGIEPCGANATAITLTTNVRPIERTKGSGMNRSNTYTRLATTPRGRSAGSIGAEGLSLVLMISSPPGVRRTRLPCPQRLTLLRTMAGLSLLPCWRLIVAADGRDRLRRHDARVSSPRDSHRVQAGARSCLAAPPAADLYNLHYRGAAPAGAHHTAAAADAHNRDRAPDEAAHDRPIVPDRDTTVARDNNFPSKRPRRT